MDLDKTGPYDPGTVVQLTAVPDSGYSFSGWNGDLSGSANPTSLTMNSAKAVTATFTQNLGTLTVTSPNGGENWARGTTHTLTWTSTGNTGSNVKIELLKGGVVNRVISSRIANNGSYNWVISSRQTTGSDYTVRITSTSNPFTDSSNANFAITT